MLAEQPYIYIVYIGHICIEYTDTHIRARIERDTPVFIVLRIFSGRLNCEYEYSTLDIGSIGTNQVVQVASRAKPHLM
ncbi:GD19825 [Drosophila simulans]|uniref:GD19825 n=1 Tax=Drosophila simulans TaxID=7240 RepID=B4QXK7_DROSI|nr:GD19825 [Drosophila simulans]